MRVEGTAKAAWWTNPVYRQMETEIAELRAENERLRSLLKPPAFSFPAKWRLSRQQHTFLSALYAQAGCVPYPRLAAAIGCQADGPGRAKLGVLATNIRRRTERYGVGIEAHHGIGYSLSMEGRATVRIAVEAIAAMREA